MKTNVVLLLLAAFFSACTSGNAQNKLNADQFEAKLKESTGVQLVDVRTADEYQSGHLSGAANIDFYGSDFASRMARLDKQKPVLVYCAVGGRSSSAAAQLKQMGFAQVFDLAGGVNAWKAGGKKLVR